MTTKVIVFGIQDYAELAHYYLMHDSIYEVVAFSVNEAYLPEDKKFKGLPVVAFENIEAVYPPNEYLFFAPMAPKQMNRLREKIYNEIKSKTYKLISYISSKATLFNNEIGDNCFILENNTIQPFVKIGNNVVLWSGNLVAHHSEVESHVTITCQVVINGHCIIGKNSFLGANSTIRNHTVIAEGTLVGMAAVVLNNTEKWGVYIGNPAKKSDDKISTSLL